MDRRLIVNDIIEIFRELKLIHNFMKNSSLETTSLIAITFAVSFNLYSIN